LGLLPCYFTLGVYAIADDVARTKLRSTNALERQNHEVRRRTHVIGIFPHEASLLRLATAIAIDASERWSTWRYLRLPTPTTRNEEVPRLRSA
jgi:transposase-like protein